jgi:hypothetical protein
VNFSELVGEEILVLIPLIEPDHYQIVKLIGVEAGGIWIESQEMINRVYSAVDMTSSKRTPAFFFPYHQIDFAMTAVPGLALNETAFGV